MNILYMDSKRVTSKKYFDSLERLYEVQLQNRKYDLIIAIDRFAYDFILEKYNNFFKNERVLTVGIENFSTKRLKILGLEDKVSALIEKRDLKSNVDIIREVFPSIKKLYIINDKSENALHTQPLIKNLLQTYRSDVKLVYLKEDSLKDLQKRFSKKEENSAALFIRFYKNKNGKLYKNNEISDFIKSSKIPIFVTDSLFLNKGSVGGKIIGLKKFGRQAGDMALKILEENSSKIEVFEDFDYVFDLKKIKEFLLSIGNLNVNYELINKTKTFYDTHRGFINFVFIISPILVILILGLIHNIYLRKKVERQLKQRLEFDNVLLNAIDSPTFWENAKGDILEANRSFCTLVGIDEKDIYGKNLSYFSYLPKVKEILDILNLYQKNKTSNKEYKYFGGGKTKRVFFIRQESFEDKKSKVTGLVTIFTDITKKKEIEKEKQKNKQFIIQQSKLAEIGEILSSIAHQWKTPLIEITSVAQELFYTKKYDNVKEDESFVKDIMTQVNYMTNTIEDFQNFIKPSVKQVEFNVYDTIQKMLQIVNHNIKYNNIKVKISVKVGTNVNVLGYKNECMQSFLNIINNAKDELINNDYKNRVININLYNEDKYLVITIEDNAGGIKGENIADVFEPNFTTKIDGHGIGLYMCKVIIEDKMNGKLDVKNTKNGAMFTIKLGQNR